MKPTQCETCGKSITKAEDLYRMNGITQCRDCAFSKECAVCGKATKISDFCHILDKPVCVDCAFPTSGRDGYETFKKAMNNFNESKKDEWKKRRRKIRWECFGIVTAIFLAIDIILFLISYYTTSGNKIVFASWLLYFIVLKIVISAKTPEYKPLSEKEYFIQYYKNMK